MRLALQALFTTTGANEEDAARRALLERKLRTNERSAGFFRRLRAAADDPTLGAPEIFAEESFPDANVVAEYLDGQAEAELARAYEDASWDSPEMLAEVGCCYDILNNDALNSVVAPKNCRRRLYYIAWEENAVNVSPEEKAPIPVLAMSFAPSEASVAQDDAETIDAFAPTTSQNAQDAKDVTAKPTKAKRKKERKKGESVRSTLEAERSLGRRFKRLSARLTMALGLLAIGYCGWQTLEEKPSETLQLEKSPPKIETANNWSAPVETAEAPLRPTTISSSNVDEIPAISFDAESQMAASEASEGAASVLLDETESPKLAALPNLTSSLASDEALNEPNWESEAPEDVERRRVGLGSAEPWESRPTIEIPAQNNDVFGKSALY